MADMLKTLNGRPLLCVACNYFELQSASGGGCDSCGYGGDPGSAVCDKGHWSVENGYGAAESFAKEIWRAQDCADFKERT